MPSGTPSSILIATDDGDCVPGMAVVPMSDLTVIDDWHTAGLRATGQSSTTVAENLFVLVRASCRCSP